MHADRDDDDFISRRNLFHLFFGGRSRFLLLIKIFELLISVVVKVHTNKKGPSLDGKCLEKSYINLIYGGLTSLKIKLLVLTMIK